VATGDGRSFSPPATPAATAGVAPAPTRTSGAPRATLVLALGLPGLGLVLVLALMAGLPDWRASLGTFQALFVAAFAFYALALLQLRRAAAVPGAAAIVFATALLARFALLPVTPTLSDDLYRYVWEGRVVAHGGNPYRQSPDDPALAPLRDEHIYPAVNHRELATIYPPLAEAGFALVARVAPTIVAFKLWTVLHDLAAVALIGRLLAARGRAPAWALVYAWNPLVLIEYAGSGHNDPTAIVWLLAALALAERRPLLSALALATGTLVKLAPLLALPWLWSRWNVRARLAALVVTGAGLAWFWSETRGATSGLAAYWSRWRNNELLFHLVERWAGRFETARLLAIAAVLATLLVAAWRRLEPARAVRAGFKAAVLAGPVAHPWYHGWWLALEPLEPGAAWIALSATAILAYGTFAAPAAGRDFHLGLAGRALEYGLPALLAVAIAAVRRARPAPARSPAG
jgi:hypothetical protein